MAQTFGKSSYFPILFQPEIWLKVGRSNNFHFVNPVRFGAGLGWGGLQGGLLQQLTYNE